MPGCIARHTQESACAAPGRYSACGLKAAGPLLHARTEHGQPKFPKSVQVIAACPGCSAWHVRDASESACAAPTRYFACGLKATGPFCTLGLSMHTRTSLKVSTGLYCGMPGCSARHAQDAYQYHRCPRHSEPLYGRAVRFAMQASTCKALMRLTCGNVPQGLGTRMTACPLHPARHPRSDRPRAGNVMPSTLWHMLGRQACIHNTLRAICA